MTVIFAPKAERTIDMAEIKSTLELAMERTHHLRMSEEDKRRKSEEEFAEAVRGLVSRRLDGKSGLDGFISEMSALGAAHESGKMIAAVEIVSRIDPAADNSNLLELMRNGLSLETSGLEAVLHHFGLRLLSEKEARIARIEAELLRKQIWGEAVIPAVEIDRQWRKRLGEMVETVREELREEAVRLGRCD